MEYDIEKIVGELDFESNKFITVGNLMLTKKEIEILNRYEINYKNCNNLKEVIFLVEDLLSDMEIVPDDLDLVAFNLSERDYYQNTNK